MITQHDLLVFLSLITLFSQARNQGGRSGRTTLRPSAKAAKGPLSSAGERKYSSMQ